MLIKYRLDALEKVAPFAGAWIEINHARTLQALIPVAPFAGAWIEILLKSILKYVAVVAPSRERGLKMIPS